MKFKHFLLVFLLVFLFFGCRAIVAEKQNNDELLIINGSDELAVDFNNEIGDFNDVRENDGALLVEEYVQKNESKQGIEEVKEQENPDFLDYPVPFVSQAPFGHWDELHQEACEEASMIMAVKYLRNEPLTLHIMEQGILSLVKWQEDNGYKVDLTAEETVEVLDAYFNIYSELIVNPTVEIIKNELFLGRLIVIPVAGRKLGNPYFTQPGPIYHMLLIRGYDNRVNEFITNDPGTRRGEGYRYNYHRLIDANHDWDHELAESGMTEEKIKQGRRVVISVIGDIK